MNPSTRAEVLRHYETELVEIDALARAVLAPLHRRGRKTKTPAPGSLQARHYVRLVRRATPGEVAPQIKLPALDLSDWYERLVEMALGQVVQLQEAFFQDYLAQLVSERPEREIDRLGREGIDGMAAYFERKLDLRLADCPAWPAVRELSYRSQLIIHSHGLASELYCRKTGLQKPGERVASDVAYLKKSIQAVFTLMRHVHARFERK